MKKKNARPPLEHQNNVQHRSYILGEAPDDHDEGDYFEAERMSTMKDFLNDNGVYHWCGDVTRGTAELITEWIIAHNMRKEKLPHLTLIITSYGGIVDYSFAVTDMMHGSAIPVHTIGLGVIASCGLMMFMAGAKGHRVLTPNTSILSHQFSGGDFGKEHELIAGRTNFDLTSTKIMNHYKRCTGLTEKKIRDKLLPPQDVWLTAEEAVSLKVADSIKLLT